MGFAHTGLYSMCGVCTLSLCLYFACLYVKLMFECIFRWTGETKLLLGVNVKVSALGVISSFMLCVLEIGMAG